jgi:uncharacterized protein (DUF2235 family)
MSQTSKKAVALFIDGTTNSKRATDRAGRPDTAAWSNVAILSEWIPDSLPPGNALRYLSGIASEGVDDGAAAQARARNIFGKYFGYGLTGKVQEAYERLCMYHRDGYNIFLFGFSRGACAARVLAGFVDEVGLLLEEKLDRVDEAWKIYVRCGDVDASDLRGYLCQINRKYERPSVDNGNQLPVYFLGVWDTVAMWMTVDGAFYDPTPRLTRVPSNVTHARQAFAIHEVRRYFPELPWTAQHPAAQPLSIKQLWFPGNHADVGGGNEQEDQRLARNALDWMMKEAHNEGLPVDIPTPAATGDSARSLIVHDQSHRDLPVRAGFPASLVRIRGTLAEWWTFEERIRDAIGLDQYYLERLVEGRAIVFGAGIPKKTRAVMIRAEDAAVRLQLGRSYVRDGLDAPAWVLGETASSVRGCAQFVRAFLQTPTIPTQDEVQKFVRAMAQWALLCESEAWKAFDRAVREAVEPHVPENHDELHRLEAWLNRLGMAKTAIELARDSVPPSVWCNPFDELNDTIIEPGWETYRITESQLGIEFPFVARPIRINRNRPLSSTGGTQ